MKRVLIYILAGVVIAVTSGGCVYFYMHAQQPPKPQAATSGGSVPVDASQTNASMASVPATASVDTTLKPLPLAPAGPAPKPTVKTVKGKKVTTTYPAPPSSTVAQPLTDFGQFEQYKSSANTLFLDLKGGTGDEAARGKKLTINYEGWLTNGKSFDKSDPKGPAFSFTPGDNTVIPGVDAGVMGMKIGGKRRLVIPPSFGFGSAGKANVVPTDSVLIFDIELVSVQ